MNRTIRALQFPVIPLPAVALLSNARGRDAEAGLAVIR